MKIYEKKFNGKENLNTNIKLKKELKNSSKAIPTGLDYQSLQSDSHSFNSLV